MIDKFHSFYQFGLDIGWVCNAYYKEIIMQSFNISKCSREFDKETCMFEQYTYAILRFFGSAKIKSFVYSILVVIFIPSVSKALDSELQCDYYKTKEKIICNVFYRSIIINSAQINNGNCLAPLGKLNEINDARNKLNRASPNPIPSEQNFIGKHSAYTSFEIPVDNECHLEEFNIVSDTKTFRWKLNYLRQLIYPDPLP